ncbi:hypothetical protein HPB48_008858 [Haemaphysalis longicornis]|uniref:SOSS complex subunit B2 n=1 Tax=Haemaphysalis longicornis TaxID=44386 RepID=A0A9J6H169_HAELO|nr:hypothetical protein HPB48_008858 [Haemaphysalis longicornis]
MEPPVTIGGLKPGMRNLTMTFIILEIEQVSMTKEGNTVRTFRVADRSGSILFCLWGEVGAYLQPGYICEITRGYASLWKGCLRLYTGRGGDIHKIGEFCLAFSETPFMSEPNPEFTQQLENRLNAHAVTQRAPSPLAAVGPVRPLLRPPSPASGRPGGAGLALLGGIGPVPDSSMRMPIAIQPQRRVRL